MAPRVSVILNCYNQGEYVAESVESVLNQTFREFELLIVDNGSTDDTPNILQHYSSDPRVRLFLHKENVAISRRFNEAVAASQGEFISFLYSDDYYLPQKLEKQVAWFEQLGPEFGVVYGPGFVLNQATGERWVNPCMDFSGMILRNLLMDVGRGSINMISPMTRRSCFAGRRFFDDMFAEGEAMFFRIAMQYKFAYQDEPLVVMRDHGGNAGKAFKVNTEMVMTCIDRWEQDPFLPAGFEEYTRSYRASILTNSAWSMIRINADSDWARKSFARAVKTQPSRIVHPRVVAGILLSFIPQALRRWLNSWADKVRNVKRNSVYVEGYR
jgi:glycosyltransferase involved in cell wall biosynthesis